MQPDLLNLYRQASGWTTEKIRGASDLSGSTPCTEWDLRTLLNHMLETQRYFASAGRGEQASPPGLTPPEILGDDPGKDFEQTRSDVIAAFSENGVIEKTMPALGIAFADSLLHGWDV